MIHPKEENHGMRDDTSNRKKQVQGMIPVEEDHKIMDPLSNRRRPWHEG